MLIGPLPPKRLRGRARMGPRAKTLAAKGSLRKLRAAAAAYADLMPVLEQEFPRTRGECVDGPRPCPWWRCRFHLGADVDPETGSLKIYRPDLEPDELPESCALDVAARGGMTLEEVGELMNVTRERLRQLEVAGLIQIRRVARERGLDDAADAA